MPGASARPVRAQAERRRLLGATAAWVCHAWPPALRTAAALGGLAWAPAPVQAAAATPAVMQALRDGGVAVVLRHAQAPGRFDPPGFRLGDCATQRNLDDAGREQARRIGAWFRAAGLRPAAVRSSPWCRCIDTARLAFGAAEVRPWDALGSLHGSEDGAGQVAELRTALARLRPGAGFEVWVSHQFTLQALAAGAIASGEGLVLRAGASAPRVVGPIAPA